MPTKRKYDDGCATAHALDLVGERWALLIVRELLFGPKRFTDLRAGLPGASPNVLSHRLRELEEAGTLRRRHLPPPAATWVYELTEWGRELEPVVAALGRWGGRSPSMRHDAPMSTASLMLALKTLFDPTLATGIDADLAVQLNDELFHVHLSADMISIMRGEPNHPRAVVETDPATLNQVILGGRDLADAITTGSVKLTGDHDLVETFLGLFPLPRTADVVA